MVNFDLNHVATPLIILFPQPRATCSDGQNQPETFDTQLFAQMCLHQF